MNRLLYNNPKHSFLFCSDDDRLFNQLSSLILGRPVVVLCIGTDLVGGDCLGPLVGQLLIEANIPAFVYGSLAHPVTALNIKETYDFIRFFHSGCVVIAVDCAVGDKDEEGVVTIKNCPLLPGLAMGKDLGAVGDISVTAVTSAYPPHKKEFLYVRLGFVYGLARRVAGIIKKSLCKTLYNTDTEYAMKMLYQAH